MRVRIDLAYNGEGLCGWAKQTNLDSVQGRLEAALAQICREPISLTVAGRTDAGVHAAGQVTHCDLSDAAWQRLSHNNQRAASAPQPISEPAPSYLYIVHRLNKVLAQQHQQLRATGKSAVLVAQPPVAVHAITPVSPDFDARFSALERRYTYLIADRPELIRPWRADVWNAPFMLSVNAMNEGARHLIGEHDFLSFCKPRAGATTIRTLREVHVMRREDELIAINVAADAFCHSMVRSLVGALSRVGRAQRDPQWIRELVEKPARTSEVPIAPACGLTLMSVSYPPANEYGIQAERARVLRSLDHADECGETNVS